MIRFYNTGDEQAMLQLWSILFTDEMQDEQFLFERVFCDPRFDPRLCLIAEYDAATVGMLYSVFDRQHSIGYILFFGVVPEERNRGIGTKLLCTALQELSRQGARTIRFSDDPYSYFLPGIDIHAYREGFTFLQKRGFKVVDTPVAMVLSLDEFTLRNEVTAKMGELEDLGYRFPLFELSWLPALITFCRNTMQEDWVEAIIKGFLQKRLEHHGFLCVTPEKHIAGFVFFGMVGPDERRFGPFGVDPNCRGLSIGKILLNRCLLHQRELGHDKSYFLWSYEQNPAGMLYRKTGFTVYRTMAVLSYDTAELRGGD